MTAPKVPTPALGPRGRAFWNEIVAAFALSGAERQLLTEICRTLDIVEALAEREDRPSLAEVRQQRLALGRLLAQLEIPESHVTERPVARRARQAAEKRWAKPVTSKEAP